jgi:hypothetical protein
MVLGLGSAVAIFKWVAIAIICYVLIRPSELPLLSCRCKETETT